METVTRTIYAEHLMTCKLLEKPFSLLPNSTLNQKFNVFPDDVPSSNSYPKLGYIGIGNKGASYETTPDGYVLTTPIPHLARHASLYNFMPFLIREANNDISNAERVNYRMRVPLVKSGVNYVAYYLKLLPLSTSTPIVEIRNVNNGNITSSPFIPELSDLSPTPPVINTGTLNNPNGDYLVSSAIINFNLTQNDIDEIINAVTILYGDPRYSIINEIAICTGVDSVKSANINGINVPYTEVIAAQTSVYISQYHSLTNNTTNVNIQLDIGSVEPLLI